MQQNWHLNHVEAMSNFLPLPFDRMGEADVREEVLAPLIRQLGYRTGTEYDIVREQSLRYPKVFLGRKNPSKDPLLRGKADYILEVSGHARWVLEAKAPGVPIDIDAIEQAWTYANHAEVRAVYFALCNGHEIQVFATQSAPKVGPFKTVGYGQFDVKLAQLANILGPNAIKRDFPHQRELVGKPLGPGLRAFARVSSGTISYVDSSLAHPMLTQMQMSITEGAIERAENGGLLAFLKTQAPLRSLQDLNERMGLNQFEMVSSDTEVSLDSDCPTTFEYQGATTFPEGSELLDTTTWKMIKLPMAMQFAVRALASGYLSNQVFTGQFVSEMRIINVLEVPPVLLAGKFVVRLV